MGSPMRYQPQGLIRINKNHPLTRQLQFVTVPTTSPVFQNFVTGQPMTDPFGTDVSFVRSSYSKWGRGRSTAGGAYRNTTTVTPSGVLGKSTLLAVVRPRADTSGTTSTDSFAQAGEGNGGWMTSMLQYGNGNRFSGQCVNGTVLTADTPVTLGECYVVGFTNNGTAGRQALYVNGVKQTATGSYTGNAGKQLDTVTLKALSSFDSGLDILGIFGWSEELTANQMADLSRNPWQLFDAGSSSSAYQAAIASTGAAPTSATASLAWTEANDGSAITASETDRDAIAWTEADDSHAVAGTLNDRAALAWAEPDDAYAALATETDREALSWSEPDDVHALTGVQTDRAALAWAEDDDAESIAATEAAPTNVSGAIAWTEQDDAFSLFMQAATGGAPGYDVRKPKRRYVVRKGDSLYSFSDPQAAKAFLHADDEPVPVKQYPAKKQAKAAPAPAPKREPDAVPEQRIDLAEIQVLAARQHAEAEYQQALARQQYETLLALLERLREEEEDDWLLMAAD